MIGLRELPAAPCEVKVFPPHSTAYGKTIAEWGSEWWAWVLSVPMDRNPVSDPNGQYAYEGQSPADVAANPCRHSQGPVFFLAGNFGGKTERTITIPCGRPLFLPVLNSVAAYDPIDLKDCRELIQEVDNGFTGGVAECEIDGTAVLNLERYRELTETCFCLQACENNVFGTPAMKFSPAAHVGIYLMIEPLCPGAHTIHCKGSIGEFALEFSYNLTVKECVAFRRGDCNADGKVNIADAVNTLAYLFGKGEEASCQDAADANDDAKVNVADAVAVLGHLFAHTGPLTDPFSACGADPTEDALACAAFDPCATTR